MPYTILIRDLVVHARHGVYTEEQLINQEWLVHVECHVEAELPVHDALEETVDYMQIAETIRLVFARPPRQLVETLVGECVQAIQNLHPRIGHVQVTIEKKVTGSGVTVAVSNDL
jgi:dihydroneopterin aldolase